MAQAAISILHPPPQDPVPTITGEGGSAQLWGPTLQGPRAEGPDDGGTSFPQPGPQLPESLQAPGEGSCPRSPEKSLSNSLVRPEKLQAGSNQSRDSREAGKLRDSLLTFVIREDSGLGGMSRGQINIIRQAA